MYTFATFASRFSQQLSTSLTPFWLVRSHQPAKAVIGGDRARFKSSAGFFNRSIVLSPAVTTTSDNETCSTAVLFIVCHHCHQLQRGQQRKSTEKNLHDRGEGDKFSEKSFERVHKSGDKGDNLTTSALQSLSLSPTAVTN